jgi:hypothetical protein
MGTSSDCVVCLLREGHSFLRWQRVLVAQSFRDAYVGRALSAECYALQWPR